MEPNVLKPIETAISSHLTKGISPIIACIGLKDYRGNIDEELSSDISRVLNTGNALNINFNASQTELDKNNFLNAGEKTYVISEINSADKFGKELFNCTDLIATGISKETGKNISFISHQDPSFFLNEEQNKNQLKFKSDLRQRLLELKDMCKFGSIDVVIVGGRFYQNIGDGEYVESTIVKYPPSIKLIGGEVKDVLGFEPIVINGPKTSNKSDDIYYDNEHRRLYFVRPKVNTDTRDFLASDVDEQKDKWK